MVFLSIVTYLFLESGVETTEKSREENCTENSKKVSLFYCQKANQKIVLEYPPISARLNESPYHQLQIALSKVATVKQQKDSNQFAHPMDQMVPEIRISLSQSSGSCLEPLEWSQAKSEDGQEGDENMEQQGPLPVIYLSFKWNETRKTVKKYIEFLKMIQKFEVWSSSMENCYEGIRRASVVVVFIEDDYEKSIETETEARTIERLNKDRMFVNMKSDPSDLQPSKQWLQRFVADCQIVSSCDVDYDTLWMQINAKIESMLMKQNRQKQQPLFQYQYRGDMSSDLDRLVMERPDLEERLTLLISNEFQNVLQRPSPVILLHGRRGVGKSCLVRRCLAQSSLLELYNIKEIAWLNTNYIENSRESFFKELATIFEIKLPKNCSFAKVVQNSLFKRKHNIVLVLQGVMNQLFIELARLFSNNVVTIVLSKYNWSEDLGMYKMFVDPVLHVENMSNEEIRTIMEPCRPYLEKASPTDDCFEKMIELCNGLPMMARIVSQRVITNDEDHRERFVKDLEMIFTLNIVNGNFTKPQFPNSENIKMLILSAKCDGNDIFFKLLLAMVHFNNGRFIPIKDIAVFAGVGLTETEQWAGKMFDLGYADFDSSHSCIRIHSLIYKAIEEERERNEEHRFYSNITVRLSNAIERERHNVRQLFHQFANNNGKMVFQMLGNNLEQVEQNLQILISKQFVLDVCLFINKMLETDRKVTEYLLTNFEPRLAPYSILEQLLATCQNGLKMEENALLLSASNQFCEVIDFLLDFGANIDCVDCNGNDAAIHAVKRRQNLALSTLIQRFDEKINPNHTNFEGKSALMIAAQNNDNVSCQLLAQCADIDLNLKDSEGNTSLICAANEGNFSVMETLIGHGANVKLLNQSGFQALWFSLLRGNAKISQKLYENGAELEKEQLEVLRLVTAINKNDNVVELLRKWSNARNDDDLNPDRLIFRKVFKTFFKAIELEFPDSVDFEDEDIESFYRYCYQGNKSELKALASKRRFSSFIRESGLFIATYLARISTVKAFCDEVEVHGDFQNKRGNSALLMSIRRELTESAEAIIDQEYDLEKWDMDNFDNATILAAKHGNLRILRCLSEHGANLDVFDHDGTTALMFAIQNGYRECCEFFISKNVNVEARQNQGMTGLMLAARYDQEDLLRLLMSNSTNIDNCDFNGWTPLMYACLGGSENCIRALLAARANVHKIEKTHGWNALIVASQHCNVEIIAKMLVTFGCQVDSCDDAGYTPLMWASANGNEKMVKILLEYTKDVDARTHDEQLTAMIMAAKSGHDMIVRRLLTNKANINATSKSGVTALIMAVSGGHLTVTQTLLRKGADIDCCLEESGMTPLMIACEYGHVDIARTLLKNKFVDVNAMNKQGMTPLMIASAKGHDEIVEMLLHHEPEPWIDMQQKDGFTALMLAAIFGHAEVVKKLVPITDVYAVDSTGTNALGYASGECAEIIRSMMDPSLL